MNLLESVVDGLVDVRSHKLRTFLQTLGVVLGVASLVAVQGLSDAGRRQATRFFAEFGGLQKLLVVNRPPKSASVTARQLASAGLTWDDVQAIRKDVPYARLVDPVLQAEEVIRRGDFQKRREITGVSADYPAVYKFYPVRGRFVSEDDVASGSRVVVLGDTAARTYFGNEDPLGKTVFIGSVGFAVVGIMQRKEFYFEGNDHNSLEWMNRLTLVPLTAIYSHISGDDRKRLSWINVVLDDVANGPKAVQAIQTVLFRRHGVEDFEVWNRSDRMQEEQARTRSFDITFLVTGIVSLVVGGIVIMNIMLASFQERVREVGVRKAIGAGGTDIAVQFLVESVLVTLLGGTVGLLLGIGFARVITELIGAPAVITLRMALVGVLSSVATGLFFGLYPALKAARLNPVEALRYE